MKIVTDFSISSFMLVHCSLTSDFYLDIFQSNLLLS